jgi:hypothetical protein
VAELVTVWSLAPIGTVNIGHLDDVRGPRTPRRHGSTGRMGRYSGFLGWCHGPPVDDGDPLPTADAAVGIDSLTDAATWEVRSIDGFHVSV